MPGVQGYWELGSLEAWRLAFLGGAPPHTLQLLRRALVARSVLRSLFSVLRGGISRPSPAGAWGSAPLLPIPNQPNSFVLFVVPCVLCGKHSGCPAGGSRPLIGFNL